MASLNDTGSGAFRTTHWTVVLEAARPRAGSDGEAFARLYLDYWPPLYGYVRRRGFSREDAEDITQSFFTRLLEKDALANLQRAGGKFRSFLLGSLGNLLANEWDRVHAQKRGGGEKPLSLDAEEGEARFRALDVPGGSTPESLFEKQWVFTLLEHVTAQLRAEEVWSGKGATFDDLRPHLKGDRGGVSYAEIAAKHGTTEGAIKVAVHRLRQRYGQLLRKEIARTVAGPVEVSEELRYLISILGR